MDRPALFRDMLQSLLANDLAGWHISIRVEPGPKARDFVEIAGEILAGVSYGLVVNPSRLGIVRNPFETIDAAFAAGSRLNLCLEEDLLVSPDAIAMALWFERNHRPDWLCLSLLGGPCGSAGMLSNPLFPDLLFESRSFNSLGFAVRREEWAAHLGPAWRVDGSRRLKGRADWRLGLGWDWSIYGYLAGRPDLRAVQPVFARATHTGRTGFYCKPDFHDRAFGSLHINGRTGCDYRLAGPGDLPHEVRSHLALFDERLELLVDLERASLKAQMPLHRIALRRLKALLARAGSRW